jgi:hypothetical protein
VLFVPDFNVDAAPPVLDAQLAAQGEVRANAAIIYLSNDRLRKQEETEQ